MAVVLVFFGEGAAIVSVDDVDEVSRDLRTVWSSIS